MSSLQKPTSEQYEVIKNITQYNIIVDSVAGSGKTTTSLNICKEYPDKNILLVTYNARLKEETRQKIKKYDINNIEIHSYHSFSYKYYKNGCKNDADLLDILEANTSPLLDISYDILIFDEAQDINSVYFQLVHKIVKDNNKDFTICIMGDRYQSIYQFNGADNRYIIYGDTLFNVNDKKWLKLKLSESFRITKNMANFVNVCLLENTERIKSAKKEESSKVRYCYCDIFHHIDEKNTNFVVDEIYYYKNLGYDWSDIFILAPSVRQNKTQFLLNNNDGKDRRSPTVIIENYLASQKVPIFIPNSDNEMLNDKELEGKLCFSTFHQSKGLERPVVIVLNFDESYFYFNPDANNGVCCNELYVACTRAKSHLTVVHGKNNSFFEFVQKNHDEIPKIHNVCDIVHEMPYVIPKKKIVNKNRDNYSVVDLIKFIPATVLRKALSMIKYEYIDDYSISNVMMVKDHLDPTENNGLFENVSTINGHAFPQYYQLKTQNKVNMCNVIFDNNTIDNELMKIKNAKNRNMLKYTIYELQQIKDYRVYSNPSMLLKLCNVYNCLKTQYIHKMTQITSYDWMSHHELEEAYNRINNIMYDINYYSDRYIFENDVLTKFKYEISFNHVYTTEDDMNITINGDIDCFDFKNNNIFEFKYVNDISYEHIIQLAIYGYIYLKTSKITRKNSTKYYLFNIKTNQCLQLFLNINDLEDMMRIIMNNVTRKNEVIDDESFIKNNI